MTAFVVARSARRLLVFQHPLAGIQLPAGTVEPGEDYGAAARREVLEETGWITEGAPQLLGVEKLTLGSERGVMLTTVGDGVTHRCGRPGLLQRGHQVRVMDARPAQHMVRVCEEIFDFTPATPELKDVIEGWVPTHVVGAVIERGFVLFFEEPGERVLRQWRQLADGHAFEVYWAPLDGSLTLVTGQDAWLNHYQSQLSPA